MYYRSRPVKYFSVLLGLFCLILMVSCSSGNKTGGDNAIAGTWEMESIAVGASQVSAAEYLKSAHTKKVPVLIFEENGTVTLEIEGASGTGTWTEENGHYSIVYGTGEDTVTKDIQYNDTSLTLEQNGYILTYTRK